LFCQFLRYLLASPSVGPVQSIQPSVTVFWSNHYAICAQGGPRRVWQWESEDDPYEKYVEASMQKEGGNVVVTCTLPTIQDGSLRFDVEQISLRDVDQNEVAGVVRNPTLTMTLPETQLESLSVSVLYMDERAFTESVADPSLLVDWSVRMKTFRLIDVLRAP